VQTPRGVIVFVYTNNGADEVTGVTYGGVAMTEVPGSPVLHTSGEVGAVHCYFLGSSVPTGAQTVEVTVSGSANKNATAITVKGNTDMELVDIDATVNNDSLENPSVTLGLNGRTCWVGIGFYSGQNQGTGVAPLTGWTNRLETDFGTQVAGCYTYNTVDSADVSAGWTQTAEDAAMIAVAVSEVLPSTLPAGSRALMGVGI
jgi:hypothetical protein